jgi:hypothetical protein
MRRRCRRRSRAARTLLACAIAAALLLVLQRRLRTWLSAVSASIIGIALRALSEVFREETV